jgi:hypothetical protein
MRSNNRRHLAAALAACKKQNAQLVIAKLDRLATKVGSAANAANADRFAENVAPIIRQVQKSGATTLRAVPAALAARAAFLGHAAESGTLREWTCSRGSRRDFGQHDRDHQNFDPTLRHEI